MSHIEKGNVVEVNDPRFRDDLGSFMLVENVHTRIVRVLVFPPDPGRPFVDWYSIRFLSKIEPTAEQKKRIAMEGL